MLSTFFCRFNPASIYGGQPLFPVLSGVQRRLRVCGSVSDAIHILDESKQSLHAVLAARHSPPVAQALTLKILNILLAQLHLRLRSATVLSRPIGLVVDPSNVCQLACPGCVHSERSESLKLFDWPNGTLPEGRFFALLKHCGPHAIGAYFCNYGEPLLNLNTPQLIRSAKTYLLWTGLSTSLSVQRLDADAYVGSGLDSMALSIDGATQPVYERFRRNGNLEIVLENIRKLVSAKRRLRQRTPVLSWNYLAFEHNAHEIPLAARMARKLGVDHFRVATPFDVRWDDPEMRPRLDKASARRLKWSFRVKRAANWNPFPNEVDVPAIARAYGSPWAASDAQATAHGSGHTCHWLYKNLVMDAGGRILPCCGAPRPDVDLVFARFDGNGGIHTIRKSTSAPDHGSPARGLILMARHIASAAIGTKARSTLAGRRSATTFPPRAG